jgi:large subunit ribosomal protein L21
MYAVIRAGGKQYRVAPGDVIKLEKFTPKGSNGNVQFAEADILAVSAEAGKLTTGGKGASVSGEIVDEGRNKKILVFHYKRKKQFKKLQGHRQGYTAIRITEISLGDKKLSAPDAPARKKKGAAEGEAHAKSAKKAGGRVKPAKKKAAASTPKKAAAKKSSKKK